MVRPIIVTDLFLSVCLGLLLDVLVLFVSLCRLCVCGGGGGRRCFLCSGREDRVSSDPHRYVYPNTIATEFIIIKYTRGA